LQRRLKENRGAWEQRKRASSIDSKKSEEARREIEMRRSPTLTRDKRSRSRSRGRSSKSRDSSWEKRAKAWKGSPVALGGPAAEEV
jgi:hypothetical protein